MPIYEYRCTTCDTVYERRRAMAEADAPSHCPGGHRGRGASCRSLPPPARHASAGGGLRGARPRGLRRGLRLRLSDTTRSTTHEECR